MPEEELPLEVGENAELGSEELGETGEAATEDFQEAIEYDFLDPEEYGGKHVKLTVEGEEVVVPLSEALNGYNAASVSTKRFQEAAEKSRQAEEALRFNSAFAANPGLTIQVIAAQQGMTVEEFLGLTPKQQQAAINEAADEDQYMDPLERKFIEQQKRLDEQEKRWAQREADERLVQAVGGLKQRYNATDEQTQAVVLEAMNRQLGIEAFPMIFESLAFRAQQQAGAQQTAQQEAEAQRRRQAAASASRTVGTGQGVTGTTTQQPAEKFSSLREAINASIEEVETRSR